VPKRQVELNSVDITLNLNGVRFSTNHAEFKYYETPAISSIRPWVGASIGGTDIVVFGSNFFPSTVISCRFEETILPGRYINESALSCIAPPQTEGSTEVDVSISLNGVDFHTLPQQYKFIDPVVRSIRPQTLL
jgi:hypothetical protein